MIDLNYKPKQEDQDVPIGAIILALLPMVWLFWQLIEWGL